MVYPCPTLPLHRSLRICALLAWFLATAYAATYDVGSGQVYPTLASLPSLSPGDLVEIEPGTYNEVKRWTDAGTVSNPIIIRGLGTTRPIIDANGLNVDGSLPDPRAVFQLEASNIQVEHLEFVNARNGNNGAGVRVTGSGSTALNDVIRDCRMDQCDMGIQSDTMDNLLLDGCEIDDNGTSLSSGYSHNIYLNGTGVTIRGCWIHDSLYGQNVKSRCHYMALLYNLITDSQDGEVGLVDSADTATANSNAVLIGNIIVSKNRGSGWNDARFVLIGTDGGGAHNGTLYAINNTFIAGAASINFLSTNRAEAGIVAINNICFGSDNISNGDLGPINGSNNWLPATASIPSGFSSSVTGTSPGFVDASTRNFHLLSSSPCIGIGASSPTYLDGNGSSQSGIPMFTYEGLGNLVGRVNSGSLDAGAYAHIASLPSAPSGLAANSGQGQIALSWTGSSGASSYDIYRGTSAGGESGTPYASAIPGTTYVDSGVATGTTYYYTVAAVNSVGVSPMSNEAQGTPTSVTSPPAAPGSPSAQAGPGQIALTWSAASGATTYAIYRATSSGGEGSTPYANGISGTSYTDTSVSPGSTYYYTIAGNDGAGTGPTSTEVSAMPSSSGPGTVATPTFSPGTGSYDSAQSVVLLCSTSGASIHYTLDGTTPSSASAVYVSPLTITKTTTINTMGSESGMVDSAVTRATYTITGSPPVSGSGPSATSHSGCGSGSGFAAFFTMAMALMGYRRSRSWPGSRD